MDSKKVLQTVVQGEGVNDCDRSRRNICKDSNAYLTTPVRYIHKYFIYQAAVNNGSSLCSNKSVQ